MPESPELTLPSNIRPLTLEQIDWSLFSADYDVREIMRQRRLENPLSFFDFSGCGKRLLRKARDEKKLSGHPDLEVDEIVRNFLASHRPPRAFYEPEDLPRILNGQDELVLEEGPIGDVFYWEIYPADGSGLARQVGGSGGSRFCLTRPNYGVDVSSLRCLDSKFCPYLEVFYVADYAGGKVLFKPKLVRDSSTDDFDGLIERRLLKLLGTRSISFTTRLDFKVVDPDIYKIRVSMESQNA